MAKNAHQIQPPITWLVTLGPVMGCYFQLCSQPNAPFGCSVAAPPVQQCGLKREMNLRLLMITQGWIEPEKTVLSQILHVSLKFRRLKQRGHFTRTEVFLSDVQLPDVKKLINLPRTRNGGNPNSTSKAGVVKLSAIVTERHLLKKQTLEGSKFQKLLFLFVIIVFIFLRQQRTIAQKTLTTQGEAFRKIKERLEQQQKSKQRKILPKEERISAQESFQVKLLFRQ